MEAKATIIKTMTVVTAVSRRVGHVTLVTSCRTSCRKVKGLLFFAISYINAQSYRTRASDLYHVSRKPDGLITQSQSKGKEKKYFSEPPLKLPPILTINFQISHHSIYAVVIWCRLRDSNPRPPDYKSGALPAELSRPTYISITNRVAAQKPTGKRVLISFTNIVTNNNIYAHNK